MESVAEDIFHSSFDKLTTNGRCMALFNCAVRLIMRTVTLFGSHDGPVQTQGEQLISSVILCDLCG